MLVIKKERLSFIVAYITFILATIIFGHMNFHMQSFAYGLFISVFIGLVSYKLLMELEYSINKKRNI